MSGNEILTVLRHVVAWLLRYALYGALILGAVSALLQGLFLAAGQLPQPAVSAFARITANWAFIGALFGGLLGLVYGLLTARR